MIATQNAGITTDPGLGLLLPIFEVQIQYNNWPKTGIINLKKNMDHKFHNTMKITKQLGPF